MGSARIGKNNASAMMAAATAGLVRGAGIGASLIVNEAKARVRVRTGHLRRTIHYEIRQVGDRVTVSIGADADYAIFQEMGTSRMAAHPYIRPALDLMRAQAIAAMRMEMMKAMSQVK